MAGRTTNRIAADGVVTRKRRAVEVLHVVKNAPNREGKARFLIIEPSPVSVGHRITT